ncbi:beta-phosphoglucomutase [Pedobacter glucosidilyticus]|nr:beta-phosphoglucomutase [Pedobacter glucosidilyticus]KHJ39022.1 beta-phosphoglucomutase [Pedobacter glucosidilyticus]
MNTIKAFIFDLDGVIVDTAVYHFKAWKKLANTLGFDFTEAQNEQLKGISRIDSLNLILGWGGVEKTAKEVQELATLKNQWYVEMINKMTAQEILPGVQSLLSSLKSAGIKCALGSASKNASLILERTGLTSFFDVIVDGNEVSVSKPNPEVFLKGAQLLQVAPQQCVVFEDALAGIEAAKNADMRVIGIGEESILKNADWVLPNLEGQSAAQILNKLEKSRSL